MPRTVLASLPVAALLIGSAAYADTRSSTAVPAKPVAAPPATPQGPKNGFPDNKGITRAMEVANEHARFLRHDSNG